MTSLRSVLRAFAERAGLVLFGLVLSMVLLEIGLRVAAAFVGPRPVGEGDGERRVLLTLGDSHTYGVHYTPEEAYPGQLQKILDERAPGRYRVINLGLPGMNSTEIAASLPEWLLRYRPFATVVCAGINNTWNRSGREEPSAAARWLSGLRVVRFAKILGVHLRGQPDDIERPELERVLVDDGHGGVEHRDAETGEVLVRHEGSIHERSLTLDQARDVLVRDLEEILALDAAHGVQLVLLPYASFPLPGRPAKYRNVVTMSEAMREVAGRHDEIVLVDPHDRFAELFADPDLPRSAYFLNDTTHHPNPRGYAEIAALVADYFEPRPAG